MNDFEELDITAVDSKLERAKAIVTIIIVAAVNIANVGGYAMDAEPIVNWVLSGLSAISIIYAWWKNQNVTEEASQAQVLLDFLKTEKKQAKHAAVKEE